VSVHNTFDFEFIELQRFKDTEGKIYAVTDRVEVEVIEQARRDQGTYDLTWYKEHSVREEQIEDLQKAIETLTSICDENSWDLGARYVKWSVRFQTPGGRNGLLHSYPKDAEPSSYLLLRRRL